MCSGCVGVCGCMFQLNRNQLATCRMPTLHATWHVESKTAKAKRNFVSVSSYLHFHKCLLCLQNLTGIYTSPDMQCSACGTLVASVTTSLFRSRSLYLSLNSKTVINMACFGKQCVYAMLNIFKFWVDTNVVLVIALNGFISSSPSTRS